MLIPINMRDGSVLAVGKGNPEWNYSAPHGAGRLMSRTKAKANLSMDEYRETMKGIYTTSINENTLDEAPMAYKSLEDIIDVIRESVDVIDVMKPATPQAIYKWQRGTAMPTIDNLVVLAAVMDVPMDEIIVIDVNRTKQISA